MIVTHVISGLDPRDGGPPVALEGLTIAQVQRGTTVRVISTFRSRDDGSRAERLRDAGVELTLLGPSRPPIQLVPGMAAAVSDAVAGSDVVHIHNLWEQLQHVAAAACRRQRLPYVLRPCGMLDPWSLSQSAWKKRAMLALRTRRDLNAAAAIHYTADAEAELAAPLKLRAPALVVSNGVDLRLFDDTPRRPGYLAQRFPAVAGRPVVVFLSRLHPKKGADILLDAFARLLTDHPTDTPRPVLLMVGPDSAGTRETLEAQCNRLGITGDVVFAGLLNGAAKVYALRDAQVFVLPSHQENFGIAVVEALAAGTPVVISDQVNIHGPITAAGLGTALPLDADRDAAFAAAMRTWLDDAKGRARVTDEGPAWVRDNYSWPNLAAAWLDEHYPRLIAEASGR